MPMVAVLLPESQFGCVVCGSASAGSAGEYKLRRCCCPAVGCCSGLDLPTHAAGELLPHNSGVNHNVVIATIHVNYWTHRYLQL